MNRPQLELIDIQQAAKYLNCNPMTIRRKIKSRELGYKIKLKNGVRKYYVFKNELDDLKEIFSPKNNENPNNDSLNQNNNQDNGQNNKTDFLEILSILEIYREENEILKKQNKELNHKVLDLNFKLGQESVRREFYQNIVSKIDIKMELKETHE